MWNIFILHPGSQTPEGETKMTKEEAMEWIKGNRSTVNSIQQEPLETWQVRIAQADAAMYEQAYWVLRAYGENLLKEYSNE